MNKWIIILIAPIILGIVLDLLKATKPIYLTVLLTLGIILPIALILAVMELNKYRREKKSN